MRQLFRMMLAGAADIRLDDLPGRVSDLFIYVLAQKKLFKRPGAGIMHAFIFWGFLVITAGTFNILWTGLFGHPFPLVVESAAFRFMVDMFVLMVVIGLGIAAWRRAVAKPFALTLSRDAWIILGLIAVLMVSLVLAEGASTAYTRDSLGSWAFLGWWVSGLFAAGSAAALTTFIASWWLHVVVILGFLVYLPSSKHLHIMTAPFNVFFRARTPRGQLSKPDLETAETYGAGKITDFSWKSLLDTYTCTECGRCTANCPAALTGKPLSPKDVILDLKHYLFELNGMSVVGEHASPDEAQQLEMVGGVIKDEVLWDCTTCRACMEQCPVLIEHVPKIVDMRRFLVLDQARFPDELVPLFNNWEKNFNPWEYPSSERGAWARELGVKTLQEHPTAEVLYWVGCYGHFDERNNKVARALIKCLQAAGVDFAILGKEEKCSGEPARRIGNEYLYQTLAGENVETLNGYNVKTVITACPHCFNTIATEYPQFGGNYRVIHHTEFVNELVQSGRLKLKASAAQTITYHDSCYLGRYHDIYKAPRQALSAIPGVELKEMSMHGSRSLCCGGGGGRVFMTENRGTRINQKRIDQAVETGAGVVASACPFCLTMMEDAVSTKNLRGTIRTQDVVELIAASIEEPAAEQETAVHS